MANIIAAQNFTPSNLSSDGLYIEIINPPTYIKGVPTSVIGIVGTASWGPVNAPQLLGDPTSITGTFGGITKAALTDPFDLCTDLTIAFAMSQSSATMQAWAVRVTDGSDTAATVTLKDASTPSVEGAVVNAIYTGTAGNAIQVVFTTGSRPNTVTASLIPFAGGASESYPNISTANSGFWVNFASAINKGIQGVRGPSNLITVKSLSTTAVVGGTITAGEVLNLIFTSPNITGSPITATYTVLSTDTLASIATALAAAVNASTSLSGVGVSAVASTDDVVITWPATISLAVTESTSSGSTVTLAVTNPDLPTTGSVTLSGGTDGRNVSSTDLIGTNTTYPATGVYTLANQNPPVSVQWVCGLTDTTVATTLQAFRDSAGMWGLFALPVGAALDTTTALSTINTVGIADYNWTWTLNWIYWYDPINGVVRLVSPNAFIGGITAALDPAQSPGNKFVYEVVGTERRSPYSSPIPYSVPELGELASAGVMVIDKPIPAGNAYGIESGRTTALNQAQTPVEYARMTNFLAQSLAGSMGVFVDKLQSQAPNDPLRASVRHTLNTFLKGLKNAGLIGSFLVVCDMANSGSPSSGINTPATIAQHFLYARATVQYLSSAWYFVIGLQGGTTVVTSGSASGSGIA